MHYYLEIHSTDTKAAMNIDLASKLERKYDKGLFLCRCFIKINRVPKIH